MLVIKGGRIHNGTDRNPFVGDILIRDGKLAKIGPNLPTEGAEVIDAAGLEVYPGFVDAHCHVTLSVWGGGSAGMDVNETGDPVTPQLRAIDAIDPMDNHLAEARKGGITCVAVGPGSSNVIGGTWAAIKTYGKRVDKMVVREAIGMKCAFGENPKTFYHGKGISSRMTNAALIRNALRKAQLYHEKILQAAGDAAKYPPYDQKSEALLPVIRREIPLKAHAHQANDIFTALRIAKEFQVDITLEHVTEGHLIVDELKNESVMMAVGPFFCSSTKREFGNVSPSTAGVLANAGCHVSIITDAPVVPLQALPLYAGMAIQAGMDEFDALRAITIWAAEHIGVQDRVGSLTEGKDADVVLIQGSPFAIDGVVKHVLINGQVVE